MMLVKEFLEMCDSFCGDESFCVFDSKLDYHNFSGPKLRLNFDDCLFTYGNYELKRFYFYHSTQNVDLLVEVLS